MSFQSAPIRKEPLLDEEPRSNGRKRHRGLSWMGRRERWISSRLIKGEGEGVWWWKRFVKGGQDIIGYQKWLWDHRVV